MDSRLIYEKSNYMLSKVIWNKSGDSEWIYIGQGELKNKELLNSKISQAFPEQDVYLSKGRNDSELLNENLIENRINNLTGKENFKIWDLDFTQVAEFNHIGLMRIGQVI